MAKKKKRKKPSKPRPPKGPGFDELSPVNGLEFPALFIQLWDTGLWGQPSDELVLSLMPWLDGPIDFILNFQQIKEASLGKLADFGQSTAEKYRVYRGSTSNLSPDLPWLDVDVHITIGHNRFWGDDIGLALDYRSSSSDPRVVATKWIQQDGLKFHHTDWMIVADTFTKFTQMLGFAA